MSQITVAASEAAMNKVWDEFKKQFKLPADNIASPFRLGPLRLTYDLVARLADGKIDLQDGAATGGSKIVIDQLRLRYDKFKVNLGIDLPKRCVGGWEVCIPFLGCAKLPEWCVFESDPDIQLPLDLSFVVHEVSGGFSFKPTFFVNPLRPAGESDLRAEVNGRPNKWRVFLDPLWLDIDPIDLPETIGNLFENLARAAIDALLGWLPGWVRDILYAIIGGIADFIRWLLNIPDAIDEWLSNLLNVSLGLFDFIATAVADYFAAKYPIFEFKDPTTVLDWENGLIPVRIPIRALSLTTTDDEAVVAADIGA